MAHDKATLEMSKTEGSCDVLPSSKDQMQNTNTVQGSPPTLATLFQPGHYGIAREIMMHIDTSTLLKLKRAVKGRDNGFYENLKQIPLRPQWACQEHDQIQVMDDGCEPTDCFRGYTKPCDGFKLKLRAGLAHGPVHGVCTIHNEVFACGIPSQWEWDVMSDISSVWTIPFKRIEDPAVQPPHACDCAKTWRDLHLCYQCRGELRTAYQNFVFDMAAETPESCEYISTEKPDLEDHIIKPNKDYCRKCQQRWRWRIFHRVYTATHFSPEPAQVFQCLFCDGCVRGWAVFGPEGNGSHDKFGLARRLKRNLPWNDPDAHRSW